MLSPNGQPVTEDDLPPCSFGITISWHQDTLARLLAFPTAMMSDTSGPRTESTAFARYTLSRMRSFGLHELV